MQANPIHAASVRPRTHMKVKTTVDIPSGQVAMPPGDGTGSTENTSADETVPVAASRIVAGIGSGSPGTVMRVNAANVHTSTARAGGQLADVCSAPNAASTRQTRA